MTAFTREALEADGEELERLRLVLHGPAGRVRAQADRRPASRDILVARSDGPASASRLLVDQRRDTVR